MLGVCVSRFKCLELVLPGLATQGVKCGRRLSFITVAAYEQNTFELGERAVRQKNVGLLVALFIFVFGSISVHQGEAETTTFRRLPVKEYRDKMKAGWIGQIAGVAWGAPTEFRWKDKIIPEQDMLAWKPEMINQAFGQDDLYVEMTFLRTLER